MYCPKCKYTSFDHLSTCPNCRYDWQQIRSTLNLTWLQSSGFEWFPGPGDPSSDKPVPSASLDSLEAPTVPRTDSPTELRLDLPEHPDMVELESDLSADGLPYLDPESVPQTGPPTSEAESDIANDDLYLPVDLNADAIFAEHAAEFSEDKSEESASRESVEAEMPIWEIELPEDILSGDVTSNSSRQDPQTDSTDTSPDTLEVLNHEDIVYDFDELDAILPDLEIEVDQDSPRDDHSRDQDADDPSRAAPDSPGSSPDKLP
ncbi:hypothetical protein SAMN05660653_01541 [Desulfonatronum thiosulfatophilum]|uniref:Uncharacterized protein n=1 Tax=Desulfonatronum thiosulfatophilum TaxID=617002 RepID=A0A1G6CIB9_9BACT|nr:hypothetical protein [Desulfonatronum thiosulfatophilum]SDB32512.1 hypothetical protein SAMN05660653_01541 [Desulfonatronum thiosulfatophilum]